MQTGDPGATPGESTQPVTLGRQLADHTDLESVMLWVRLPPERSVHTRIITKIAVLVEQPGVLATLSRWRSRVQIPAGTLHKNARCANWQSGQTEGLAVGGSNPSRATLPSDRKNELRRLGIGGPKRL